MKTMKEKLKELILDQFEESDLKLTDEITISSIGGFDSLTAFCIIDAIEDNYGIKIESEDLNLNINQLLEKINE